MCGWQRTSRTLNHWGVAMAEYQAEVTWTRNGAAFTDNRYSRAHTWSFDGGAVVPGSSSPHSVRIPMSDPAAVDPEEALVAAASSCHMLYFLALAARAGLVVDSYADAAIGIMEELGDGRKGITRIHLRPRVTFSGERRPTDDTIAHLHHESHDLCYIANTLKAEILTEGSWTHAA